MGDAEDDEGSSGGMTMGQAVGMCLRKYSDFSGRGRRSEFWWFVLAETLVSIPLQIWLLAAMAPAFKGIDWNVESGDWVSLKRLLEDVEWDAVTGPLAAAGAISLLMVIPMLAAASRRLHDMGQSGWWQVLMVMGPLSIVPIIMWILDSQPHENRHGPDPKAGERVGWGYGPAQPPS